MTSGNESLSDPPPTLGDCKKIANKVALPPIQPGMSKVALIARYRAALIAADNRIEGVAECLAETDAVGAQK